MWEVNRTHNRPNHLAVPRWHPTRGRDNNSMAVAEPLKQN